MTVEQIVDEVSKDLGLPKAMIEKAKLYATLTAIPHRRSIQNELSEKETHIVRMYFRALLYRIAHDPEYRRELKAELQRRVERN
jgi:hypothetical protein